MATETKFPDSIAASTNLTGAVTAIDEDPDSPDANWLTATSATADTDVRVTFPTPTGAPSGSQEFRVLLRKTAGTPNPTSDVMLYQGGVSRATLVNDTSISNTTGQVVSATWNSSDLSGTLDGSDVECRVVSVAGATAGSLGAMPAYSGQTALLGYASSAQAPVLSPTAPATVNAGDVLIYHVMTRDDTFTTTCTTPSGFTAFPGNPYGTTTVAYDPRVFLFWKIADGTEDGATINVTTSLHSTSSTNRGSYAIIYSFSATNGFDASPIEGISVAEGSSTNVTGNGLACPSVTCGGNNRLAVLCAAVNDNLGSTGDLTPTGETGGNWVQRGGEYESGTGGDATLSMHTADMASGGTISGGAVVYGSSGSEFVDVGFALVPATTAGSNVNTVEIGAIEWNVTYTAGGGSAVPAIMQSYRRRRA